MRTLAIDLGSRRVGLAMSDEGGRFATPYDVLAVASADAAVKPVAEIVRREGVGRVVVGLPLNMDDSIGPAARQAVAWGATLSAAAGGVPIVYVDERLSSFAAEQALNARKRGGERLTRDKKKRQLDALAAADFLQAYLDDRLPAVDVGPF